MDRRILIAEDHAFVRMSIQTICAAEGIYGIDEVSSYWGLMKALKSGNYTHLILDITLEDGNVLSLLEDMFQMYPNLKILIFSSQPAQLYDESLWFQFGVQYVCKAEEKGETISRILAFLKDTKPAPRRLGSPIRTPFNDLSLREKQVLNYLLKGLSHKETATKLKIKVNTIATHKRNILTKTKTKNLLDLQELAALYLWNGS